MMKKLLLVFVLAILAGCATDFNPRRYVTPAPTPAPKPVLMPQGYKEPIAELLVFCHPRKYQCQKFLQNVPFEYDENIEAYILPMVEVNVTYHVHGMWYRKAFREGRLYSLVKTMPTFVVWQGSREEGHELARWTGYEGMEEFLEQVNLMIEMYDLKQW